MEKILLLMLLMSTIVAASVFGDRGTKAKLVAFVRRVRSSVPVAPLQFD
jgi:hypothetical protein